MYADDTALAYQAQREQQEQEAWELSQQQPIETVREPIPDKPFQGSLKMDDLNKKLNHIQQHLNAPKDAFNSFAKYNYRSAESILQAVKPLLAETQTVLTIADSIETHSNRVYIKATATLSDGKDSISTTALAREPESKKGSDESQITGAASSYARKYALCGLFAIDDNKDADATNTHNKEQENAKPKPFDFEAAKEAIKTVRDLETLEKYFKAAQKKADENQLIEIQYIYNQRKADFKAAEQE